VQRAQNPADQLSTADYVKLLTLIKNNNPDVRVFGGHYSRLGEPWTIPVSSHSLREGLMADREIGLAGSMVFDMPLMMSQCRSSFDACDSGIFHPRKLSTSMRKLGYDGLLFWPNEAVALAGWYQRFSSGPMSAGQRVSIALSDSQALAQEPSATRDEFRKRIVGLRTGTIYLQAPVGIYANKSTTCDASNAACPGADPHVKCEIVCSGKRPFSSKCLNLTMNGLTMHWMPTCANLRVWDGSVECDIDVCAKRAARDRAAHWLGRLHSCPDNLGCGPAWHMDIFFWDCGRASRSCAMARLLRSGCTCALQHDCCRV
jgi:hypothetical protein